MQATRHLLAVIGCLLAWSVLHAGQASQSGLAYEQQLFTPGQATYPVRLPAGYQLELLTDRLAGPRLLSFHSNGDLFIGSRSGHVYRLPPPYNAPQSLLVLADYPHSIAFRDNRILIAQTSGLYQAPYVPGQGSIKQSDVTLLAALPGGGGHNSRSVAVGPDRRIYLSLGISGNCSDEYLGETYPFHQRRGGILVLDETGEQPQWQAYATGLRNPVGFAWHPQTGVMYASNNGPDHWGFDLPPEYFSRIDADSFHGMPWFQYNGKDIVRDDCIQSKPPRPRQAVAVPVATFPARNAPMGVAFMPSAAEGEWQGHAIVALRGSWATAPGGGIFGPNATRRHPKLVKVRFQAGQVSGVDDLLTGFQLDNGERWARPVGVAIGPDGAIYFTSDSGINGLFRLRSTSP